VIKFIDKKLLLTFHDDQIRRYGGKNGIRDEGLLDSALAQPEATFDGEYVHNDLFLMAAAYGFHLCQNHPFFDGNKRTALVAIYIFLYVNGHQINGDKKHLYAVMIGVASGSVTKLQLADFLATNSIPISK
jgi:death on curing protein